MKRQDTLLKYSELIKTLQTFFYPFRWKILTLLFMGFVIHTGYGVLNPLIIRSLFDEGIIQGNFPLFLQLSAIAVLLFTLIRLSQYGYQIFIERVKNELHAHASLTLLHILLQKSYREIEKHDPGYYVNRVDQETRQSIVPFIDHLIRVSNALVILLAGLGISLYLSWRVSIILFTTVPFLYFLSERFGRRISRESIDEHEQDARYLATLHRTLSAWKTIRLFNLDRPVIEKNREDLSRYLLSRYQRLKVSQKYVTWSGILTSFGEMAVILSGGYEILQHRMTFGAFMGFLNAFWTAIQGLNRLVSAFPELARNFGGVKRIHTLIQTQPEKPSRIKPGNYIALHRVTFSWDTEPLFINLNLVIPPGERVLITGPNGSGKTTLAAIVSGLLEPDEGNVVTYPASAVSAVLSPFVFPPLEMNRLVTVLPSRKLQTILGHLGMTLIGHRDPEKLSTGQKKRFALALGLSRRAKVYILDEPLNGLDAQSRGPIRDLILKMTEGRTLIIISHDLTMWEPYFDRIYRLSKGRLIPLKKGTQEKPAKRELKFV